VLPSVNMNSKNNCGGSKMNNVACNSRGFGNCSVMASHITNHTRRTAPATCCAHESRAKPEAL
jgi:hypothetical protein